MSDDLVERLRSKIITHTDAAVWVLEAADRIEELETQLSEARQVGKEWFEEQKKARKDANAAEAQLAKAREEGFWAGRSCGGAKKEIDAALAELEGQNDE